jgi:hypothetical protein
MNPFSKIEGPIDSPNFQANIEAEIEAFNQSEYH